MAIKNFNLIIMSKQADNVPQWVRIAVGILALMNIAFGVMGYFDMSLLFKNGAGLDLTSTILKNASFEFAARNLAIGLALGFVTVIKGAPEALIILTITRALIEIQTIIISIVQQNINAMLLMPLAFLVFELLIIKTLVAVIKKEEGQIK
jgi:hypothetical protein